MARIDQAAYIALILAESNTCRIANWTPEFSQSVVYWCQSFERVFGSMDDQQQLTLIDDVVTELSQYGVHTMAPPFSRDTAASCASVLVRSALLNPHCSSD